MCHVVSLTNSSSGSLQLQRRKNQQRLLHSTPPGKLKNTYPISIPIEWPPTSYRRFRTTKASSLAFQARRSLSCWRKLFINVEFKIVINDFAFVIKFLILNISLFIIESPYAFFFVVFSPPARLFNLPVGVISCPS